VDLRNTKTTVACDATRVFQMSDRLFLGLTGLMTDVMTLDATFRFKLAMYKLKEGREIKPRTFANLVSSTLYGKRFGPYFSEPVIAGLDKDNKPFLCCMDLLGALAVTDDFAVSGTCAESLFGTCETFYRPDMNPDELFETISQSLLAALDRDSISGWGAVVHIITKDGVTTKNLAARMD
jgi:20S proteasome subunit beta 3